MGTTSFPVRLVIFLWFLFLAGWRGRTCVRGRRRRLVASRRALSGQSLEQQKHEAPPFQQQRKGRPKGRRSRSIAHLDEAIQQMIHERANQPRSLKAEVAGVVKILEKHGVKIEFDQNGRCKLLERRINEAWEAASRA